MLLTDDEGRVRGGLRAVLEAAGGISVVGEASDGAVVVPLVRSLRPDVVLTDIRMPLVEGITATHDLRSRLPQPPKVLVVTTFGDDDNVDAAPHAGADGFLPECAGPDEIVAAVRVVARGDSLLFPATIRVLAAAHGPRGRSRRRAGADAAGGRDPAPRRPGPGRRRDRRRAAPGLQTVKTHVSSLLRELGARDRTQAVIAAYETHPVPLA